MVSEHGKVKGGEEAPRWYHRVTGSPFRLVEFAFYAFMIIYVAYYKGTERIWRESEEYRVTGHYLVAKDHFGLSVVRCVAISLTHCFCRSFPRPITSHLVALLACHSHFQSC